MNPKHLFVFFFCVTVLETCPLLLFLCTTKSLTPTDLCTPKTSPLSSPHLRRWEHYSKNMNTLENNYQYSKRLLFSYINLHRLISASAFTHDRWKIYTMKYINQYFVFLQTNENNRTKIIYVFQIIISHSGGIFLILI